MNIELKTSKTWTGKVRAAFMFEGDKTPLGFSGDTGAAMARVAVGESFFGSLKKTILLRDHGGEEKVIVAGLGKRREFCSDRVRTAAAKAVRRAEEIGCRELGLVVPDSRAVPRDLATFVGAAVEGVLLKSYRYDKYRTPKPADPQPLQTLTLVFENTKSRSAAMEKAVRAAQALAEAVNFTRDLVNEPPSPKAPELLAERAKELARGRVTVKVLHKAELENLGMGGILRVGAGSHQPPCLVHFTYTPRQKPKSTFVYIGKGITFDSGGLSIKPSAGMELMKDDMAGAASVFGLFHWLGTADVPVLVHGLAPLAENLPGGGAQKPGDIIKHFNGKTAEVITTDAEGRHLLADALAFGSTFKPDLMIDAATLTGACVVALGDEYSGLMGHSQTIEKIKRLGLEQGEYFWELPLPDRYRSHLESRIADMKHVGKTGVAGTITAGLFLREFVGEGIPWVHIDIAGPSYIPVPVEWDYLDSGATAVPLRTIIALVRSL